MVWESDRRKERNGKVHHVNGDERKGPKDTATCLSSILSSHLISSPIHCIAWKRSGGKNRQTKEKKEGKTRIK